MEIIVKTHEQRIVLLCVQCEGLPMKFRISIIIVFCINQCIVFVWKAFGSVKASNFVSKNLAQK